MDGKTALLKKIITALLVTMVPQQLILFLSRDLDNPRRFTFISFAAFCLCFLVIKITGRPENLSAKAAGFFFGFFKRLVHSGSRTGFCRIEFFKY